MLFSVCCYCFLVCHGGSGFFCCSLLGPLCFAVGPVVDGDGDVLPVVTSQILYLDPGGAFFLRCCIGKISSPQQ